MSLNLLPNSFSLRLRRPLKASLAFTALGALACSGSINGDDPAPVQTAPIVEPEPIVEPDPIIEPAPEPEKPLLQAQVEDILNRTCGECHGQNGSRQAGMNYIEDLDALANNGKIKPGDAAGSLIMLRIRSGTMPPEGALAEPPTADEIEQIAQFINGWKGPSSLAPEVCEGQFISYDEVFDLISRDLLLVDADDRENIRYLGLSNRFNAGVCNSELDVDRWALSKLVNSLSTRPRIEAPLAVDERQLIYRVDMRDYGWDRAINVDGQNFDDGWEAIIASSPYAVPFEGNDANIIGLFSNTAVPFLSSDALGAAASIGNLYYALADVPGDVNTLLTDLRIDVEQDFDRGEVARAGTGNSGVSREDRLVERHEIGIGNGRAYWQAFDFAEDDGQSIFTDPLDFVASGSESIYSLPNGLHGYAIFDANGNTVETSDLLFDTLNSGFDITSAVSCMTCHSRGFLQVKDQVRPFVLGSPLDFSNDEITTVRETYPAPEDMDEIIISDRVGYQDALTLAGVPLTVSDPVSDVFWRFQEPVKFAEVAGELGVTPDFLQQNIVRLDPRIRVIDPDSDRGIRRRTFDELFGAALCIMQLGSENAPSDDFCDSVQ